MLGSAELQSAVADLHRLDYQVLGYDPAGLPGPSRRPQLLRTPISVAVRRRTAPARRAGARHPLGQLL